MKYPTSQSLKNIYGSVNVLFIERDKLQQDLAKMDQFEEKLREEQVILKQKVADMEKELITYGDLDKLRADADTKKQVG